MTHRDICIDIGEMKLSKRIDKAISLIEEYEVEDDPDMLKAAISILEEEIESFEGR